ncbi:MAG: DNA repair protein RecN [Alteromonadaceae bacterium]|nr:DNA repair protein RecN [Alteromonadaceae bacterium]
MLLNLSITNFAIVRQLDIDWHNAMTTITGETGAGKSIAIDALGLCLGERALTNTVRPNCKKAELTATFDIYKNSSAINWLTKQELAQSDDEQQHECILRRVISNEGRSKAYINGSQVPLSQLKQLGALLINIHGQQDHQLIVKSTEQRRMLDEYANNKSLLDEVKYHFSQWRTLQAELQQLQHSKFQREAQRQLLQYQVQELDEFNLQAKEFESIETEFKRYSHAQDLLNDSLQTIYQLSANEDFNIIDSLRKASENITQLSQVDDKLTNIAQLLTEALIPLEEANDDLKHYHEQLELDPESFLALEQRYSGAMTLAKKHQISPEKLPEHHQNLKQELALISSDETRLIQVNEDIDNAKQHYLTIAQKLSHARHNAAKNLSTLITQSMQELNMPSSQFLVQVIPLSSNKSNAKDNQSLSANGIDEISFVVSMNVGQPLEAMHKVASGGELSRIGLAIQVILAEKVITPTLIFDEVDVGISGPTAAMVGKKLQQLGKNTQVICVTHLPQVASKGHQQLFVSKLSDGEHTETKVTELSQQGRVREIARLLAGDSITDSSLANAQELLAS